jgi:tetratricopeptide (TPR) repeat protein
MKKIILSIILLTSLPLFAEDLLDICLNGGDQSMNGIEIGDTTVYKGNFDSDSVVDKLTFSENEIILDSSVRGIIKHHIEDMANSMLHISSKYMCFGNLGTDYGSVEVFKYSKLHDRWFGFGNINKELDKYKSVYEQSFSENGWDLEGKVYKIGSKTELLSLFIDIKKLYKKKEYRELQGLINGVNLHNIKVNKKNISRYNDIAYYLQKANINKEAITLLEQVISFESKRAVAHYNIADAYDALGKKVKALIHYTLYVKQMKEMGKTKRIPKTILAKVNSLTISELYETARGDLNRDDIEDKMEVTELKNAGRVLTLFLGTKQGGFKKVATNSKVILGEFEGGGRGDPFVSMVIKNGYFSVEHYGGGAHRWKTITTFKYSKKKKNWFLHKLSFGNYVDKENLDEIKWKIETVKDFGDVLFEDYDKEYGK